VLRTLSPEFDALYADSGRPSIAPEYILRALLWQVFYSVREGALLSQLCRRLRDGPIIICVLDTTRLIEGSIDETGRRARFSGEGLDSVGFKQKPRLSLSTFMERAAALLFGIQQSAFRAAKGRGTL